MTAPQRMILAEGRASDAGRAIAGLCRADMAALGLRPGDTVAIEGGRRTHARVRPDPTAEGGAGLLRADQLVRQNVGGALGATVAVTPAPLPTARTVCLTWASEAAAAPWDFGRADPAAAVREALVDIAMTVGDRVEVPLAGKAPLTAAATAVEPEPAARIGPQTVVTLQPDPAAVAGTPAAAAAPDPRPYPGVGGLSAQIAAVRAMIDLPLHRPDLFAALGLAPPRGVLFTGPPGSGKTLLARAVAEGSAAAFFQIDGPEILSKHYGESEAALRDVFASAAKHSPAVIFIDEIDAIAPRRGALSGEKQVERRVVAQLLTLMDGLDDRGQVIVIAATNLPDSLDPALRRPGRFDRELRFTAPGPDDRRAILGVHLAGARLSPDADLDAVAERTHGYVGADLAALAREAGMAALARAAADAGGYDLVAAAGLAISAEDLDRARGQTRPSALRDMPAEAAPVRFQDIGGLDHAKQALTEAVIWPRTHPALFRQARLGPVGGVLLAGPPGSGKTRLARALASESGLVFIPVPAERLMVPELGGAERAVADVFARAREAAPALLFLDEIDALAARRGTGDRAEGRVVTQFLRELDGATMGTGLTVLAATNRLAALDPAFTRAGRFDLVIEIGLPTAPERAEILEVYLRGRTAETDVSVAAWAEATAGASGADLEALVAQAARHALRRAVAARADRVAIGQADFDAAHAAWAARQRILDKDHLA